MTSAISTTTTPTPTAVDLESICARIHTLDEQHHLHIAAILRKEPTIKINENNNGIMINMSFIPSHSLQEIQEYLDFLSRQESEIRNMEDLQEECKQQIIQ